MVAVILIASPRGRAEKFRVAHRLSVGPSRLALARDCHPKESTDMRTVGRYEILREIGRGGMAVVYAARQPDLDRQVALKELSSFPLNSPEFAHRFLRESRLAGSLNHPHIVTVHEDFEHDRVPYIAQEHL